MPEAEHLSRLLAAARRESRQSNDVCHPEHLTDEFAHSIYHCCGIHSMCTVGCKQREEAVQDDMVDDEQDSHTAQPQADVHDEFSDLTAAFAEDASDDETARSDEDREHTAAGESSLSAIEDAETRLSESSEQQQEQEDSATQGSVQPAAEQSSKKKRKELPWCAGDPFTVAAAMALQRQLTARVQLQGYCRLVQWLCASSRAQR